MLARPLLQSGSSRPWRGVFGHAIVGRSGSPVSVVCVGDSITEGQQASVVGVRWVELVADQLGSLYDPTHTTARYYPPTFGVTFTNPVNPWTGSGNTRRDDWGLGRRAISMAAGATASVTFTGTGFKLLYPTDPTHGVFSYAIDGGGATNVDENAATHGGNILAVGGLSDTSHTLVIARVSGTPLIEGILECDGNETAGVRVWEAGHGGYKASDYLPANSQTWLQSLTAADPDLVVLMLGTNDYSAGVAKATFKSQMTTLIANIRAATSAPSLLLMAAYQAHIPSITVPWTDYVAALTEIVTADGRIGFVDLVPLFGGYIDPPGGGLIDADRVHPSDAGHVVIADAVMSALTG